MALQKRAICGGAEYMFLVALNGNKYGKLNK